MYHKWQSYDKWFLGYQLQQTDLFWSSWAIFCTFTPLNSPKNQNFEKMKKTPGDMIILHNCTKNHDHRLHCSWDVARDRCNCYFSFWAIFCPFTPVTPPKMKISKKWKIASRYYHFTQVYLKTWSLCYTVPKIWHVGCHCFFSFCAIFCTFTPLTAQKMKISQKWKKTPADIINLH